MNETTLRTHPGRGLLLTGIFVALAGVGIFIAQFNIGVLRTPWYMPIMATAGAGLMIVAMMQSGSIPRWLLTGLFVAFAGMQWFMFLVMAKAPAYTGPAIAGKAFPNFGTTLADGSAFGHENLKGDKNAILVFFRGRW